MTTPAGAFDRDEVRADGLGKVSGTTRYTADRVMADALHLRYVVSPVAHGVVRTVDTSAATAIDGVVAILTGEDCRPIRIGRRLQDWPLLAWDRVRFIGERVVAIAAVSDAIAERAAAAVRLEIDPLPALFDPFQATSEDAPILHPEAWSYAYLGPGDRPPVSHPNVQGEVVARTGLAESDPDAFEALFATAPHSFTHHFETGRQHQGYLETHGAIATVGPDGGAVVTTTNKQPFALRNQMARALDMPVELLEVASEVIGGDFGGKGLSFDEYICLLLSRRTGRPVRMTARYEEELSSYAPRHGGRLTVWSALDDSGRILAHDATLVFDGGAYAAAKPLPELILPGGLDAMSPYDIPNLRISTSVVYSNTVPGGHMRCPGELQAAFATESHVEEMARAIGMDPLEFRRHNAMRATSTTAHHEHVRVPMTTEIVDRLAAARPDRGPGDGSGDEADGRPRGVGFALVARRLEGGRQSIQVALDDAGGIVLTTGLPDQGTGLYTAIRRVAAARLSLPEDSVSVRWASTATTTPDLGVGASRGTFLAGRATEDAVSKVRVALEEAAAEVVGGTARLRDGAFESVDGGASIPFADIASLPAVRGLSAVGTFDTSADGEAGIADFTFAGLVVGVRVDVETGLVTVTDASLVADVGSTVINPLAHQGQIDGGFAQGLGAALMEELVFDEGQVQAPSLADYRLPAATDVPSLATELILTSPGPGPFGTKMAGELSPSLVAPAIANAIEDATGVRIRRIPMTPERVLCTIREASAG